MIRKLSAKRAILILSLLGLSASFEGAWTQPAQPSSFLTVCLTSECTHNSIQAAIDAAKPGDTIKVLRPFAFVSAAPLDSANRYSENISVTKPLTLDGAVGVVLAPRSFTLQPTITIDSKAGEIVITGFTIETASRNQSILVRTGSKAKVEDNVFLEAGGATTGIHLERGAQASIAHNRFSFVSTAIETEINSVVSVRENFFIFPGEAVIVKGQAEIVRNQINASLDGVRIDSLQPVLVQHNTITAQFSGVEIQRSKATKILDNVLVSLKTQPLRVADVSFEGIRVQGSPSGSPLEAEISRNVIVGHQFGIVVDIRAICESTPAYDLATEEAKVKGVDNVVVNSAKAALCPPAYPWPQGFVKP